MGVNITTIVYLRVLIIEIGSTIVLMVVEAQGYNLARFIIWERGQLPGCQWEMEGLVPPSSRGAVAMSAMSALSALLHPAAAGGVVP